MCNHRQEEYHWQLDHLTKIWIYPMQLLLSKTCLRRNWQNPWNVVFFLNFELSEFCTFKSCLGNVRPYVQDLCTSLDSDLTSLGERILEIFPQSVHKPAQCEFKPQIDGDKRERHLLIESHWTINSCRLSLQNNSVAVCLLPEVPNGHLGIGKWLVCQ